MSGDTAPQDIDGVHLNERQRIVVRYTLATLVDLAVLNFYAEHWQYVTIDSFTISFLAAIILQLLLMGTLKLEHTVAGYFKAKPGTAAKVYRGISTYLILLISKFVMLGIIDFLFGDALLFGGPLHGVIAFIVVVLSIVIAEGVIGKIVRLLAHDTKSEY